ncbi:MAG: hypothetical protein IJM81_09160 [Prevotella sp.]|nr:hypothetical protein [Prevotella sp.]
MKKIIAITIVLVAMCAKAQADDYTYPYLAFVTTGGSVETVSVADLQITFTDSQLVLTNASTSKNYTLSELSKMYFSETEESTTAIEAVPTNETDGLQDAQWFTTDGRQLPDAPQRKGVYIVKNNGRTYKVAVK